MKKIIACLSTLGVIAVMSIATASPASALTMSKSSVCSASFNYGSAYYGSYLSGYTTAVNHGCTGVQAAITYKLGGSVKTSTSVKSTSQATIYAGTTAVVQHQGFIWVGSSVYPTALF